MQIPAKDAVKMMRRAHFITANQPWQREKEQEGKKEKAQPKPAHERQKRSPPLRHPIRRFSRRFSRKKDRQKQPYKEHALSASAMSKSFREHHVQHMLTQFSFEEQKFGENLARLSPEQLAKT